MRGASAPRGQNASTDLTGDVLITPSLNGYSRVVEVEAWGVGGGS